ncbi:MAG: hypothetical protein J2P20_14980 [Pseudonocardia sp.]|nr:hypothetical protein [Pseudonocardia sp.]
MSSSSLPSAPSLPPARTAERGPWSMPVLLGLVRAEARKTVSTSAWWALLIPAGLLGLLVTLIMAAGSGLEFSPSFAQMIALDFFSAKFAVVFGAVCATGEYRHRTITTSYLTASGRAQLVLAKAVVAAVVGAGYGVVCAACGVLGMVLGGGDISGGTGAVLRLSAMAVLVFALWAVLGVGVGMLISNQLATIVLVLVYLMLAEKMVVNLVALGDLGHIDDFVPGGAATATLNQLADDGLLGGTLTISTSPWWVTLLVFAGYAVLALLAGTAVAQRRDVT